MNHITLARKLKENNDASSDGYTIKIEDVSKDTDYYSYDYLISVYYGDGSVSIERRPLTVVFSEYEMDNGYMEDRVISLADDIVRNNPKKKPSHN